MSEENKKQQIMDETFAKSFYTTSVPPEQNGINYNFKSVDKCYTTDHIDEIDKKINYKLNYDNVDFKSNLNFASACSYLLPCGICERTGRQCPKYWQYESPIRWGEWTCDTNMSGSTAESNLKYTTKSGINDDYNYKTKFNK